MKPSEAYLEEASPVTFTEAGYLRAVAEDYKFSIAELHKVLETPEGRRQATKSRFALFCLLYLRDNFVLTVGPNAGKVTVNDLTLHAWRTCGEWLKPQLEPAQLRWIWVAPRESGKSSIVFMALPLWLGCHNHAKFVAAFSHSWEQSKQRLSDFRNILRYNRTIRHDYYEFTTAARRGPRTESDNSAKYKATTRFTLFVAGAGGSFLGLLEDGQRPDVILLDDLEPGGESFSPHIATQRLRTLRESILGLAPFARIVWSGTTVGYSSMIHQALTKGAVSGSEDWAGAERFQITRFPAIVTDGQDKRSMWPAKWPLEWLESERERNNRTFSLNFENLPLQASDGSWWNPDLFVYTTLPSHNRRILSVDPGLATKTTSDPTGISVVSLSTAAKMVSIDECFELRAKSVDLKRVIINLIEKYPDIDMIVWESNQGNEMLAYSVLGYDFAQITGVNLKLIHTKKNKLERAELLLNRYKSHQVVHREGAELKAYETELLSMPFYLRSPNMLDSVGMGVNFIATAPLPVRR